MWFFSRVNPLVPDQMGTPHEPFPTFGTRVWLLPCVASLVAYEVGIPIEALATFGAEEEFLRRLLFAVVCNILSGGGYMMYDIDIRRYSADIWVT